MKQICMISLAVVAWIAAGANLLAADSADGNKAELMRLFETALESRDMEYQKARDAISAALKKKTRPEIMDALRPMIHSGDITPEMVEEMYNGGWLKAKGRHTTVLENFLPKDIDRTGLHRHHDFPVKFEKEFH